MAKQGRSHSGSRVVISAGELLPWKGRWWRVVTIEDFGRILKLELLKETTGALKTRTAHEKWVANHPKRSDEVCDCHKGERLAASSRQVDEGGSRGESLSGE